MTRDDKPEDSAARTRETDPEPAARAKSTVTSGRGEMAVGGVERVTAARPAA